MKGLVFHTGCNTSKIISILLYGHIQQDTQITQGMQRRPVAMSKGLGYCVCKEEIFPFARLITHAQTRGDYQTEVKNLIFLFCAVENTILHVGL